MGVGSTCNRLKKRRPKVVCRMVSRDLHTLRKALMSCLEQERDTSRMISGGRSKRLTVRGFGASGFNDNLVVWVYGKSSMFLTSGIEVQEAILL